MKYFITLVFAIFALVSSASAQWYVPAYCKGDCRVTDTLVCAWNGECYNMFKNNCQMRRWNCDHKEDFVASQTINCLISRQCQHIPVNIPE